MRGFFWPEPLTPSDKTSEGETLPDQSTRFYVSGLMCGISADQLRTMPAGMLGNIIASYNALNSSPNGGGSGEAVRDATPADFKMLL